MNKGITATVFGGSGDPNKSAYDEHFITDDEIGVSLPSRLSGERPKVRVTANGKSVVAAIVDVGPWNTHDPYWLTGARPQAETGTDLTGRKTNRAGIDLTPAVARALGIDGKGVVDWEFVGEKMADNQTDTAPQPAPQPTTLPAKPQFDEAGMFQFIAAFKQRARRALVLGVPFYNAVSPDDPIKPADIFPGAGSPSVAPAAPAAPSTLGWEHIGIGGLITTLLMQSANMVGPAMGANATTKGSLLTLLFGGLASAGTVSKIGPTLKTAVGILAKILAVVPK